MYWNASPFRSQAVLFSLLVVVILVAAFVPSVVATITDDTDLSKVLKIDPPVQVLPEDSKSITSDNSQNPAKHSPPTISDPINDGILGKKKKKGIFKKTWKGLKNNAGRISIGAVGIVGLSYWLYNKYYPSGGGVTPNVQIGLQQMMPGLSGGGAFGGQAGKPVEKPKSQSSNATVWWIVAGVVVISLLVGGFIVSNVSGDNQDNQMQDRDDDMERGERRRHHRRADRGGHRKRHKKQRRDHR